MATIHASVFARPAAPARRAGYVLAYHGGATNHCPACAKSNWFVGRSTAECAFCGTALPIAPASGHEIRLAA